MDNFLSGFRDVEAGYDKLREVGVDAESIEMFRAQRHPNKVRIAQAYAKQEFNQPVQQNEHESIHFVKAALVQHEAQTEQFVEAARQTCGDMHYGLCAHDHAFIIEDGLHFITLMNSITLVAAF